MISIIIATKDRHKELKDCINSIIKSSYNDYEIIIIDQSNKSFKQLFHNNKKIHYVRINTTGKSNALNIGIKKSKGSILAFTDDDCLVDVNWLKRIVEFYRKNKEVVGIFGTTLVYQQDKHKGQICPASSMKKMKNIRIVNQQVSCTRVLGVGNNMSFKKEIFNKVGLFSEWLGPGSSAHNSEEDELVYRILDKQCQLAHFPSMIVYHNRWLDYNDYQIMEAKYSCGTFAFYLYYFLKGDLKITRWMIYRIKNRFFSKIKIFVNFFKKGQIKKIYLKKKEFLFMAIELIYIIKGFLLALFHKMKDFSKVSM